MTLTQGQLDDMYQVYKDGNHNIEGIPQRYEIYLGKPTSSGMVLTSDTLGKRSWTSLSGGGMVYPGAGIAVSNALGTGWAPSITPSPGLLKWTGTVYTWDNNTYLTVLPSHTHGNITNAGAIGSTTGVPIITTTSGVLTVGSFGTTAGTFAAGDDSRFAGIGAVPTQITVANEASDVENFVAFFTAATGNLAPKTNANFKFNSATGELTVSSIHATGNIYAGGEVAAFTAADPGSVYWDSIPVRYSIEHASSFLQLKNDVDVPTDGKFYGKVGGVKGWFTPSGGVATYPGVGIALSTGSGWDTSITNNSTNWNTAYTDRMKWDGGDSGLTAATGRTSLGLASGATADISLYAPLASPTFTGTITSGGDINLPAADNWRYIKNSGASGGLKLSTGNAAGVLTDNISMSATGNFITLHQNTTCNGNLTAEGEVTATGSIGFAVAGWRIVESSTDLLLQFGNVSKGKLMNDGSMSFTGEVTAFATL